MLAGSSSGSELIKRVWVEYGEGCSEEDIDSVRKTGLFYKMLPDGTCKLNVKNVLMEEGVRIVGDDIV